MTGTYYAIFKYPDKKNYAVSLAKTEYRTYEVFKKE